ncbi:hypothetical protein M885DRAFT_508208 [Pelagophyceae sp. CCMP2097]|nr:hypothetical protein M885DRAFT_508208 [Pelagophyceae sp. CCMP2097]
MLDERLANAQSRAAADAFLQAFLGEGGAVTLAPCAALLSAPQPSAVHVFAGHALHCTLRNCVLVPVAKQRSHVVVDDAEWHALRDSLVSLVDAHFGDRAVLTQVARALAALALKMEKWPAHLIIPDIVSGLKQPAALVEVLRALPDELDAIKMRPDLRAQHRAAHAAGARGALEALWRVAQGGAVEAHHVFDAAAPWLARTPDSDAAAPFATAAAAALAQEAAGNDRVAEAAAAALLAALDGPCALNAAGLVVAHAGLQAALVGPAAAPRARALAAEVFSTVARGRCAAPQEALPPWLAALATLVEAHRAHALDGNVSCALGDAWAAVATSPDASVDVSPVAAAFATTLAKLPTALCWDVDVDGEDDERQAERDVLIDALRDACKPPSCCAAVGAVVCTALRSEGGNGAAAASLACARTLAKVVADADFVPATAAACLGAAAADERAGLCACAAISALAQARRALPHQLADVAAHFACSHRLGGLEARAGIVALMHVCDATDDVAVVRGALAAAAAPIFAGAGPVEAPRRAGQESVRTVALRCLARHGAAADMLRDVLQRLSAAVVAFERAPECALNAEKALYDVAVVASAARQRRNLFEDDAAVGLATEAARALVAAGRVQASILRGGGDAPAALEAVAYAAAHCLYSVLAPVWKDSTRKRFSEMICAVEASEEPLECVEAAVLQVACDVFRAALDVCGPGAVSAATAAGAAATVGQLVVAVAASPRRRLHPQIVPAAVGLVEAALVSAAAPGCAQRLVGDAAPLVDLVRRGLTLAAAIPELSQWTRDAERSALRLCAEVLQVGIAGDDAAAAIKLAGHLGAASEAPDVRSAAFFAVLDAASHARLPSGSIIDVSDALLACRQRRPATFETEMAGALQLLGSPPERAAQDARTLGAAAALPVAADAPRFFKKHVKALCGGKRKGASSETG